MLDVKFQYAILLLAAVKKSKGEPVKVAILSKEHKVSSSFMAQVARLLRMRGLIKAKKGPGGGYVQKKKDINVLDVNEALYSAKEKKLCAKDEQGQKVLSSVDNQIRLVLKDLRLL